MQQQVASDSKAEWEKFLNQQDNPTEKDIIPWNPDEPIQLKVLSVSCGWESVPYDEHHKHLILCLVTEVQTIVNEGKNIRLDIDITPGQKINPKFNLALIAYGGDSAALRFAIEEDGDPDWALLCGKVLECTPKLKPKKEGNKPWEYYYQRWQSAGLAGAAN